MSRITNYLRPTPATSAPGHHFFGYYDKQQWDENDRYLLTNSVEFIDRSPKPSDRVKINLIDCENDYAIRELAESRAWCWQQGNMLQWLPGEKDTIIFNDRVSDRFIARMKNVKTGAEKVLPRPVYTVSGDGCSALSLNFARNAYTRPGYGYNGLPDWRKGVEAPDDDGVYRMNLDTGEHELIISIGQLLDIKPDEAMQETYHWVNHILFNPSGTRFIFLHRWANKERTNFITRLCTAKADGSEIFVSDILDGSHFIWVNDTEILIWAATEEFGQAYYMVEDVKDMISIFGEQVLTKNGHCTVSPDGKWVLTDEYPDVESNRPLILYNIKEGQRIDIDNLYSPPELYGELRCDLHPRWNRAGDKVCVDSAHTGERQMYVYDMSSIVKP